MTTVVALGGHVLAEGGSRSLRETLALLGDDRAVLTHGNGPQVGEELLRDPTAPIHVAVARTQGELGAALACAVGATAVVTHVVVDGHDAAFAHPTKPVGRVYEEEEARRLAAEHGWQVADDPGRGFRRVVASPAPLDVVELEAVRSLLEAGRLVVACGGGGIPVVSHDDGLAAVDAVVDKDRASALLATDLAAKRLLVLTDVGAVYRGFRTSAEQAVGRLTPDEAEALLPELAEGSMRPKVEACAAFVRATGGEALITSAASLPDALAARGGTRVAA